MEIMAALIRYVFAREVLHAAILMALIRELRVLAQAA